MKIIILAGLFAAAGMCRGEECVEVIKTPVGLKIREFTLPNQNFGNDRDACDRGLVDCHHGNATIRLIIDNPTGVEQPLTIDFPFGWIGYSLFGGDNHNETRYVATRMVPPGKDQVIDLSVPCFGRTHINLNQNWRFIDASGKAAEMRGCYGYGSVSFNINHNPMSGLEEFFDRERECLIAISPSFPKSFVLSDNFRNCVTNRFLSLNRRYIELDRTRINPAQISDWRNLACFDTLVFTHADYEKTSGEFKELVNDYLAAGGKLLLADTPEEIDCLKLADDLYAVNKALRGYGISDVYPSDAEAMAYTSQLKFETPFGAIVIVLLVFAVIAGPVLIFVLARKNKRLQLLWIFPVISIVSSIAVAAVIVFANGVSVKVKEFVCEKEVPELARKVVVKNTVYVAPFTMTDPIRCPSDALVTFDSGDNRAHGDYIVSTPDAIEFLGNWTPSLWPVRTRSLQVIRTGKEAAQ